METDKITLPSGEKGLCPFKPGFGVEPQLSKWRFIDIDRIEDSEEHKDKFEKELCDKIPINNKKKNKTGGHQTSQEEPL